MADCWTTQDVTCRYFLNGVCWEGAKCHFSHDCQSSRPSIACRYYLRGVCAYGENCSTNKKEVSASDTSGKEVKILKNNSDTSSKSLSPLTKSVLCTNTPKFLPQSNKDEVNHKSRVTSEVTFAQVAGRKSPVNNTQEEKDGLNPDRELCQTCTFLLFSRAMGGAYSPPWRYGLSTLTRNLEAAVWAYFDLHSANKLPQMTFLKDVTIGEGESVPPNTKFVKTWKITNNGDDSWPNGCQLIFTGGNRLGAPNQVSVNPLLPGHEVDISVAMISPVETGLYFSKWRMSTLQGNFFGDTIWVILQVDSGETLA